MTLSVTSDNVDMSTIGEEHIDASTLTEDQLNEDGSVIMSTVDSSNVDMNSITSANIDASTVSSDMVVDADTDLSTVEAALTDAGIPIKLEARDRDGCLCPREQRKKGRRD